MATSLKSAFITKLDLFALIYSKLREVNRFILRMLRLFYNAELEHRTIGFQQLIGGRQMHLSREKN